MWSTRSKIFTVCSYRNFAHSWLALYCSEYSYLKAHAHLIAFLHHISPFSHNRLIFLFVCDDFSSLCRLFSVLCTWCILFCLHYFLYLPPVYPSLASSCVILIFIKASQLFGRLVILHCIIWNPVNHCLSTWHDSEAWRLLCCWISRIWLAFTKTWANRASSDMKRNIDMSLRRKGMLSRKLRVNLL